jgi:diaminopimelate epimerase
MISIPFYKYQGTGNDFILIDHRQPFLQLSTQDIHAMCDRHFGIGADGLMLLEEAEGVDFKMVYFNSDGRESSMCGNGGRCITSFAKHLGLIQSEAEFLAIDGHHQARVLDHGEITLHMKDVTELIAHETYFELNTGSPHYVAYVDHLSELDMKKEGALIRYSPKFKEEGINVNFIDQIADAYLNVRTYERGVEDETLSCGTGVTACALVHLKDISGIQSIQIKTPGGLLNVRRNYQGHGTYDDIWLTGPAEFVFKGEWKLRN